MLVPVWRTTFLLSPACRVCLSDSQVMLLVFYAPAEGRPGGLMVPSDTARVDYVSSNPTAVRISIPAESEELIGGYSDTSWLIAPVMAWVRAIRRESTREGRELKYPRDVNEAKNLSGEGEIQSLICDPGDGLRLL